MSRRLLALALEKQRLVWRSEELRRELAGCAGGWAPAFAVADRLRLGLDWLRRHPQLVVATVVALFVARPRGVLKWAGRGLALWRGVRSLRAGLQGVGFGRQGETGTNTRGSRP